MKKLKYIYISLLAGALTLSGCSDWLTVYPENQQANDAFWKTKEDVEAVVNSGYYYLRQTVESQLIPFGELRGSILYSRSSNSLQNFQTKSTEEKNSSWGPFYKIVNTANSIIHNADKALDHDATYDRNVYNSHLSEAYFLRALAYFYIVRNWREAPLIIIPYEDDSNSYHVGKSSEAEIIDQIKLDITTALQSGAAKEYFDTTWETKGRATKWALYALMADVCLWSEDYETAIKYCDALLDAQGGKVPSFMATPTRASWFTMFNPGNSNESIFEIQWNYEFNQINTMPQNFLLEDSNGRSVLYEISSTALRDLGEEYTLNLMTNTEAVRSVYGGYYYDTKRYSHETAEYGSVWKYIGGKTRTDKRTPTYYDPNFIIYRVAEVILMKAEALVLKDGNKANWEEAVNLINRIRTRANLPSIEFTQELSEVEILTSIMEERSIEFIGEGKRWYDILRFGRRHNNKYKSIFLVENVLKYNSQASQSWLNSVLINDDALFLPVWDKELKRNNKLTQNPYYN